LSISRIKQSWSLVLEQASIRSKFLTKLLHLSTQAFERSITHLTATGINPDSPLPVDTIGFPQTQNMGDRILLVWWNLLELGDRLLKEFSHWIIAAKTAIAHSLLILTYAHSFAEPNNEQTIAPLK
jgi:hypothetical protein